MGAALRQVHWSHATRSGKSPSRQTEGKGEERKKKGHSVCRVREMQRAGEKGLYREKPLGRESPAPGLGSSGRS